MQLRLPLLFGVALAFLACLPFALSQQIGPNASGYLLPNGWTISPLGKSVPTGDLIMNMTRTPDGKAIVALHSGFIQPGLLVLDAKTGAVLQRIPVATTWLGLAWNPAGDILYVSGGGCCRTPDRGISPAPIYAFRYQAGKLELERNRMLKDSLDATQTYWSGLVHHPTKPLLFAANRNTNEVIVFDTTSGKVLSRLATEVNPYELALSRDDKFVYATNISSQSLSVFNADTWALEQIWRTGLNPGAMAVAKDGRVFVACSNDDEVHVLDSRTGQSLEVIVTALYPRSPEGSTPNALLLDEEGKKLYIANADNNNVAVADISKPAATAILGFLPSGWYPSALAMNRERTLLFVGNTKGTQSAPTPIGIGTPKGTLERRSTSANYQKGSVHTLTPGAVSFFPLSDALADLRKHTAKVIANTPYRASQLLQAKSNSGPASIVPTQVGLGSPIKHIVYIIKENRTYDQVFGDLPQGNGDPELTLFPRKITPNHHKLAEEFVLFDNFFVDGEVSSDGHQWSTAAYATDFKEKSWPPSYSRRASEETGSRGLANVPKSGYIWDEVIRKGLTLKIYGDDCCYTGGAEDRIRKYFATNYGSWKARDYENAKTFIADLNLWEKNFESKIPQERMPNFTLMMLPEDHTYGTTPGKPTPIACVGSNDYALGQIVDSLSHSKYWGQTAIFVVEDDAQEGPDHVDARRSIAFAISPYIRRGSVDHTLYTTSSMLRTMELLLGLRPMSQYDAAATPMYLPFRVQADLKPFKHLKPQVDVDEMNTVVAWGAKESKEINFSEVDRAPSHQLNEILWKAIKGPHSPMPAPRSRFLHAQQHYAKESKRK
jgi:DNA-binding beta-propeller fold protein YncE